jgi:L-rhamnose mutarotase
MLGYIKSFAKKCELGKTVLKLKKSHQNHHLIWVNLNKILAACNHGINHYEIYFKRP